MYEIASLPLVVRNDNNSLPVKIVKSIEYNLYIAYLMAYIVKEIKIIIQVIKSTKITKNFIL